MNGQDGWPLSALLRRAGDELRLQQPPPGLQARMRAAVAAQRAPAPRPAGRRVAWWAGGMVAASLLLGSALLFTRLAPPAPLVVDDGVRFGVFMPLAPAERWPAGGQQAWLVRTEMPGERLAALGLPYDPARAGDSVRAELLMHPSGEVLAVRFMP